MRLRDEALPCFGVLLCARIALAEPSSVPLPVPSWTVPEGCPSLDFVQNRVRVLLDRPNFELGSSDLAISGSIALAGDTFVLSLDLASEKGHRERRFEATDCRELGEAAALVLAVTIDPNFVLADKTPRVPFCELPPVPHLAAPAPRVVAAPNRPQPSKASAWELAFEPTLGFGALPSRSVGTRLEFGRRVRQLRFRLSAYYEGSDLVESDGRGGTFTLFGGRGAFGYVIDARRSHLGLGVGFDVGRLSARGFGVEHPKHVQELWLAPAWSLDWTVTVGGSSELGVMAEGFIPLGRPELQLNNSTVFRPHPVGGRAALVLRIAIP
jgi:hypothetical protein